MKMPIKSAYSYGKASQRFFSFNQEKWFLDLHIKKDLPTTLSHTVTFAEQFQIKPFCKSLNLYLKKGTESESFKKM